MFKFRMLLPSLLLVLLAAPAAASDVYYSKISSQDALEPAGYPSAASTQPNLVSFGLGWFDSSENTPRRQAVDVRAEYRWGLSVLSSLYSGAKSWDRYAQVHPFAGIETSSRFQIYALGGLGVDIMLFQNLILTPSFGFGLYGKGDGKDLGSVGEFRSQIELGYRFHNEARTSVYYSRTSNLGLDDKDPSASTVGIYLHVPTTVLFKK